MRTAHPMHVNVCWLTQRLTCRFTQCKAIHIWGMEGPSAREAAKGNSTEISGLGDSGLAGTDGERWPPDQIRWG